MFDFLKKKRRENSWLKYLPLVSAIIILAFVGTIYLIETPGVSRPGGNSQAVGDAPPTIDFTWTPRGPVDLKEFRGHLVMKDDVALDFTTYQMRVVEINKTVDLPVPGMMGKEYDTPIYLGLLADDSRLADHGSLTVEFSIADSKGQRTTKDFMINLKHEVAPAPVLSVPENPTVKITE